MIVSAASRGRRHPSARPWWGQPGRSTVARVCRWC